MDNKIGISWKRKFPQEQNEGLGSLTWTGKSISEWEEREKEFHMLVLSRLSVSNRVGKVFWGSIENNVIWDAVFPCIRNYYNNIDNKNVHLAKI